MRLLISIAMLLVADASPPVVSNLRQLGPALTACYRAPDHSAGSQLTVRFSLTSRGSILGKPMVTYAKLYGSQADQRAFTEAIFEALRRCTPLNLSPDFGQALAGRILTLRFIGGPAGFAI